MVHFFGEGGKTEGKKGGSMNGEEMRKGWNGLSEEILSGMAEWREQHPKATFREIESEVDKRLAGLRARM